MPAADAMPVGGSSPNWHNFLDAYYRTQADGTFGYRAMGSATDDVHGWSGLGCAQDFAQTDAGGNTIKHTSLMEPGCAGAAWIVTGPIWDHFTALNAADAPDIYGYPTDDAHAWGNGLGQNFSSAAMGWNIMTLAAGASTAHDVRGGILAAYVNAGGATGGYGYPTTDEYNFGNGTRQDFQGGSLVYEIGVGVHPYVPPPPAPALPARIQHALDKVGYELHSPDPTWSNELNAPWSGWCEAFVEIAYGTRHQFDSAIADYTAQRNAGRIHTDIDAPPGALVFYGGGGGYGHVGISVGGRQVISTWGYYGQRLPVRQFYITNISNPYYGWAWPPDNWPGR